MCSGEKFYDSRKNRDSRTFAREFNENRFHAQGGGKGAAQDVFCEIINDVNNGKLRFMGLHGDSVLGKSFFSPFTSSSSPLIQIRRE